jgi:hypothetical protein
MLVDPILDKHWVRVGHFVAWTAAQSARMATAGVGDERDGEESEELEPQFPFDSKTTECVLDLRALCALPVDQDEDGVMAFRALMLPKGKTLHVPNEPGCYATLGPWRTQIALSLVHFVKSTKRKAELLLSFVDYGMLSSTAHGIFTMSLQLPLTKQRNVYEETPRFTPIADVRGFTSIKSAQQPWAAVLKPALARQSIYSVPKLFSAEEIIHHLSHRLEARIKTIASTAREGMATAVADLARQDKRLAEKQKARFESRLASTLNWLTSLPPSRYDRRMEERIMTVETDATVEWLKTPQRAQLETGNAEFRSTSTAIRRLSPLSPGPAAAASPAATAPAPAAPVVPAVVIEEEDEDEESDLEEEESQGAEGIPELLQPAKRARTAPARFAPLVGGKSKQDKDAKERRCLSSFFSTPCSYLAPSHTLRIPSVLIVTLFCLAGIRCCIDEGRWHQPAY